MSKISRKGKRLTTKHKNKNDTEEEKIRKCEKLGKFQSFFSLSGGKQENNKDDSLFHFEAPVKNVPSEENEGDIFKFPNSSNKTVIDIESFPEVPLAVFDNKVSCSKSIDEETLSNSKSHKGLDNSDLIFKKDNKYTNQNVSTFIEVNNSKQNEIITGNAYNDVPICDVVVKNKTQKINTETNSNTANSASEQTNQCPICLRTVSKYLSHMKSCAAKNNLSTQQLLSALKLHKKQVAERKELGLDLPVQSFRAKVSPKKSRENLKKGDSNLQLAMALSASLHSAEEDEVIQEAEALKEAGLTVEAEQKLSILEKFVFVPILPKMQASSKSRLGRPLLLRRTKEDRERILSEKIAIVLITEEEKVDLNISIIQEPRIKSRLLKKLWNKEAMLWRKAHCSEGVEQTEFYVESLSHFVTPSKSVVGEALRRLSQLPGRLNTPKKDENDPQVHQSSNTPGECGFSELPTPPRLSISKRIKCSFDAASTVRKSTGSTNQTINLSEDWKALVGSSVFSDIEVKCSGESMVPAHKLVFHVRCPSVLSELVRQENSKDMLVCDDCSRSSVLAFLEFVYCGTLNISQLSDQDLHNIISLADRLNYSELKSFLRTRHSIGESNTLSTSGGIKKELFRDIGDISAQKVLDFKEDMNADTSFCSPLNRRQVSEPVYDDTSELRSIPKNVELNCTPLSDERGSPDMFNQSSVIEGEAMSQEDRDDLDILASLVGKTSAELEIKEDITKRNKQLNDIILESDSPSRLSLSEPASCKRKVHSSSESEDFSISKKPCPDLSSDERLGDANNDDYFDLTQSSTSSVEKSMIKSKQNNSSEVMDLKTNSASESENDDCIDDLTQRTPTENSPKISVDSKETPQNINVHQEDFVDQIWDGYEDDYLYFNYEHNTPDKMSGRSLEKKSTGRKHSTFEKEKKTKTNISSSSENSSKIHYISSDSNSPINSPRIANPSSKTSPCINFVEDNNRFTKDKTQKTSSPSPKTSCEIKNISSNSKSPTKLTQKTLYDYSPLSVRSTKEKHNKLLSSGSDVELLEEKDCSNTVSRNPRRNLNSQFDFSFDSKNKYPSSSLLSQGTKENYQSEASFTSVFSNSPQKNQDHLNSPSSLAQPRKDSLTAMQRLMDDSLEISDSVFATADALLESKVRESGNVQMSPSSKKSSVSCQMKAVGVISQKNTTSFMTPPPEIIVSDNVTPLLDYSAMKTPLLKKELRRFGLKPSLGRRKAKLLLKYIYDQTHPLVPEPKNDTYAKKEVFKQPQGQPPKSPIKNQQKLTEINLVDSGSDSEESCSQLSTSSTASSCVTLPEESFCEEEDFCSQDLSANGDVRTAIRSLIIGNPELHKKVLMYEPIYLEEFMALLKTNGIKTNANYVKELLDEQCITFRTSSWKAINEKRKKKQRSPKKKTKNTKCNPMNKESCSPTKGDVVKKRGRPKKIHKELDKTSN